MLPEPDNSECSRHLWLADAGKMLPGSTPLATSDDVALLSFDNETSVGCSWTANFEPGLTVSFEMPIVGMFKIRGRAVNKHSIAPH